MPGNYRRPNQNNGQTSLDGKAHMKKICYFINSDWYFELHWVERATAARAAGYEIHVVCHFIGDDIKNKLTQLGMICHNSSILEQSLNPINFFFFPMASMGVVKKNQSRCSALYYY